MGCACNKGRARAVNGVPAPAGTYRVMVNGRQVFESSDGKRAEAVAVRFQDASILAPGESA